MIWSYTLDIDKAHYRSRSRRRWLLFPRSCPHHGTGLNLGKSLEFRKDEFQAVLHCTLL